MLEQKNKNRARVRLIVFFILSIHVIGLMALLMQGCRKPVEPEAPPPETNPAVSNMPESLSPPPAETSAPPALPPMPAQPQVAEPLPPPVPAAPQEYVVVKGDSFYSIAKKFGVTMKAIQDANPNVQPTRLQIGQKLKIPPPASTSTPATTSAEPAGGTGGQQIYTVKSGDTLSRIAAHYHTTVKALRSENNLITDRIKVGQKLKIPAETSAPAAPAAPVAAPAATNP